MESNSSDGRARVGMIAPPAILFSVAVLEEQDFAALHGDRFTDFLNSTRRWL